MQFSKNIVNASSPQNDLLKSLKPFFKWKTLGTDGLNAEFYQSFWPDIRQFPLASINYSLEHGTLSIAQRRVIISLLPKGDKDRLYLKNWRPISFLNVGYKILAKALANRLIEFLPQLIDEDQTGYVKKRFIGNNIRIIEEIMIYTTLNEMSGILLCRFWKSIWLCQLEISSKMSRSLQFWSQI